MAHFDLVIIGAGSGNTIVDERFAHLRVAIIESGPFGGTCLNRGCIPSKMYVHPAELADEARRAPALGVDAHVDGVDWASIRARVLDRVDGNAAKGREYRESLDHVTVYDGVARFTGVRRLHVELAAGGAEEVTADAIVLATGTRPVEPDIPGLAGSGFHTSDTIMRIESLPRRIGIVGGGYVGSEFAHVFDAYGSRVTQLDSAPVLLSNQDEEVSEFFTDAVSRRWDVRLETSLDRVTGGEDGATTLHLSDGSSVEVDVLLLAVGRRPNSDLLDLTTSGVEVDDSGRIVVDEHQRTTADGVWALGDASSPEPLKHVANQDARVVQHNLLHPDDLVTSDHRFVPQAVFASPQVASVGLTEAQAHEQGIEVAVGHHDYRDVAYGWSLQSGPDDDDPRSGGFVKLLGDPATGQLVGAHLVGPQASVLVQPLIQAMSFGQPVAGLARGQYWIHPALTEVVENALVKLEKAMRERS